MMASPHTLVEGVIISSYAIRANHAFIYVRGEVLHVVRRLQAAVAEAYAAGHLGTDIHGSGYDLDVVVHAGAGAYICGEETALLDSLEGRRGQPRLRPPFPAVAGLYASPDGHQQRRVDRVRAVHRQQRRRAGSRRWAPRSSKGMTLYSLSGHVERPGQYEAPLGITLRELLDLAGGVRDGHQLKFWTPGGSSTPLLTAEHLDVPLDYEGVGAAGLDARHQGACRSSTRPPAWCAPCCAGPSSTSTSRAASARRAARAPGGSCRCSTRLERGQGRRRTSRSSLDQCDNILGPLVLRARRRRDEPDHVRRSSTSATSTSPTSSTAAARSTRSPPRLFVTAGASA